MSAPDIAMTADMVRHVDSAIQSGSDDVDRLTHRRFWNAVETNLYDWPNFQRAYPWRLWLDEKELAEYSTAVLAVGGDTGQGVSYTTIPSTQVKYGPQRYGPPYNYLELDRSTSAAFGSGPTPQQSISLQGTVGYWTSTRAAGSLSAAVSSTTATSVSVSDSSLADVGDVITVDSESMLVSDNAMASTGQQNTSGITTADASDVTLGVADGTQIHAGEVLAIDSEWMLAISVTGNNVTVERAYGGTVLASHSASTAVYALRSLTVQRGFGGTTAAAHSNSASITAALVPGQVRELAIAEALNYVFQKTSGYARTIGENQTLVPGGSLPDLRKRVFAGYGRKVRPRVI